MGRNINDLTPVAERTKREAIAAAAIVKAEVERQETTK